MPIIPKQWKSTTVWGMSVKTYLMMQVARYGESMALVLQVFAIALSLALAGGALHSQAAAQSCRADLCRETAPLGALLHDPNSKGTSVWTTSCGPNSSKPNADQICRQISSCAAAGGFGKFLQAVTFDCEGKNFDGYFGLDGMTFGILDWTSNNLPPLLQTYSRRDKTAFDEFVGKVGLSAQSGCVDGKEICRRNMGGALMCDAKFHEAFSNALKMPEFQKAQAEFALSQYESRISVFASLGLKTEFGNTAMAVVANNLRSGENCRPATWKKVCSTQPDENKLVECMLDQYSRNECRGGNPGGARKRADAIREIFKGAAPSENIHPSVDAVIGCSDKWGIPN